MPQSEVLLRCHQSLKAFRQLLRERGELTTKSSDLVVADLIPKKDKIAPGSQPPLKPSRWWSHETPSADCRGYGRLGRLYRSRRAIRDGTCPDSGSLQLLDQMLTVRQLLEDTVHESVILNQPSDNHGPLRETLAQTLTGVTAPTRSTMRLS